MNDSKSVITADFVRGAPYMEQKKYVAYVGTYTHGSSRGIYIYDLDVENGRAVERKVVPINNPFYIKKSHNGK